MARSHYPQPIGDEREVDEGHEHDIKLLKPREDPAEAFESTEQPFDLIAPPVHDTVVFSWALEDWASVLSRVQNELTATTRH